MKHFAYLLSALLAVSAVSLSAETLTVGVLAHKGMASGQKAWAPLIKHLDQALAQHSVKLQLLDFDEIDGAVAQARIDFLIANSSIFAEHHIKHGITPIATLVKKTKETSAQSFGAVIFCSSDTPGIQSLADVQGHSLLAVAENSFGGYHMGAYELSKAGVDLSTLKTSFAGSHPNVVHGILAGDAKVGTVRTGIIEDMIADGLLDRSELRILGQQEFERFNLICSTPLYPEWPFAALEHTPAEATAAVQAALWAIPDNDPSLTEASVVRWIKPLDYSAVIELRRSLKVN